MRDLPLEPFEAGFTVSAVSGDAGHANLKPVMMNMGAPAGLNPAALEKYVQLDQMPGFRFHPTDEELVGYYLTNMVDGHNQKRILQLIPLIDLYRFDPWELPAMAASGAGAGAAAAAGEGPWFFFCPRDKKYPNGPRPNRVTHAGYWKATGTDRPVRGSNLNTIGLKKTLVFYVGRAPRGAKSNWVMNEYRLGTSDHLSFDTKTASNSNQGSRLALNIANVHGQEKPLPQPLDRHAHEDHNFVAEWSAAFCYQSELALCRIYKKAPHADPPGGCNSGCEVPDFGPLTSTLAPALGSNATTNRAVITRDDPSGTCIDAGAGPGIDMITGESIITFSTSVEADYMVAGTDNCSHKPSQQRNRLPGQFESIRSFHAQRQSQEVQVQHQSDRSAISTMPRAVPRWMQLPSELSRSGLLDHIAGGPTRLHDPSSNLHPYRTDAAEVRVPLVPADIPDPPSRTSLSNPIKLWLQNTKTWLQSDSEMPDSDPIPIPALQELARVNVPQRFI